MHGGWAPDVRACSLSTPSCQMQTLHLGKIETFTAKVGNLKTMSFHQMGFGTHVCSHSVGLPVLSEPIWLMLLLTSDPRKDLGRRPRWLEKNGASSGCQKPSPFTRNICQRRAAEVKLVGPGFLIWRVAYLTLWLGKAIGKANHQGVPCQCQCQCHAHSHKSRGCGTRCRCRGPQQKPMRW